MDEQFQEIYNEKKIVTKINSEKKTENSEKNNINTSNQNDDRDKIFDIMWDKIFDSFHQDCESYENDDFFF